MFYLHTKGTSIFVLFAHIGYKKPGEVERKYVIPFFDSLFPFLPECIRKPLRFGYEFPDKGSKV